MESNNHNGAPLAQVRVSCSYDHSKGADGRHRFYVYAVAQMPTGQVLGLGHLEIEAKDLEIAKVLCQGYADAIMQQPVEIVRP